jgi:MFS family permease
MLRPEAAQDWRAVVAIYWVTSLVEGLGVSQVYALLPSTLAGLGVPDAERLSFIGLFGSLLWIVGLPLVPLWGVWADKYSRKAVIIRSALVEAVVFAGFALSREPWHVAVSMLLIGFQLGNTGVMLAGIRDVTPRPRLGLTIAVFGASTPIGFAVGPALAGLLIDGLGQSIPVVFAVSASLSIATALLLALGSREIRPEVVPTGPLLRLAFGAVRGVFSERMVRRLFLVYGIGFLANQIIRPYVPVLVERLVGLGPGLASGIALVSGTAALTGALISPISGAIGDRVGFRPVLIASLAGAGIAVTLLPLAPSTGTLAVAALAFATFTSGVGAMVIGLLATEVPSERRSATLNLVYLPLYVAGVVGPTLGSLLVGAAGIPGPFLLGGVVFLLGAAAVALIVPRQGRPPVPATARASSPD